MNLAWKTFGLVILPLLLAEFTELAPWLAERITRAAARRLLIPEQVERYSEEWLADVAHCPGKATKIAVSAGHYAASLRLRAPGRRFGVSHAEGLRTRRRVIAPALTGLVIVGGWFLASDVLIDPERRFLLPDPDAVVRVAFLNAQNRTDILSALWLSTWLAGFGLAISVGLAVPLGALMSRLEWLENSIHPYISMLQRAPVLAMVPLIGFWFDFGMSSRLIVIVLSSISPVVSGTISGLRSVEPERLNRRNLHAAGRLICFFAWELPAALPRILSGVQVGATLAVVGSVVGDFFFKQGDAGIGVLIDVYRARLLSEQLFGAAIAAVLLGVLAYCLFGILVRIAERSQADPLVDASTKQDR